MKKNIQDLKGLKTEQNCKDACLTMWWYIAHQKDGYSERDYFEGTSNVDIPKNRSYSCHWFLIERRKFCCSCKLNLYSYRTEDGGDCGNVYSEWKQNNRAADALAYYEFIKNAWTI